MTRTARLLISLLSLVVVLGFSNQASAQSSKEPEPAPIPAQIAAAQKVFVANGGGADLENLHSIILDTVFHGGPDRAYNEFYADVKSWDRFQLVSSPADADLVFEIGWILTDTGLKLPVLGQIRLQIIDPKTHITLWTVNEYVAGAILLGNRDKNFDRAMNSVVGRLKALGGPGSAPDASPSK